MHAGAALPTMVNARLCLPLRRTPARLALLLCALGTAWAGHAQTVSDLPLIEQNTVAQPRAASIRPVDGVEINYDLLAQPGSAGPGRLRGVVEVPHGSVVTSVLVNPGASSGERVARLDTQWKTRVPGPLQTIVLGDTLGSGGGWSRPVRFGGVRLGRALVLRPGYSATPEAAVAGTAALPATALALSGGAVQARTAARELLLARPWTALPATGNLAALADGDFDYEFEAGRLRAGWGTADDHYGDNYLAAAYRQGLWAALTAEARAEWTPDRTAGGLELSRAFFEGSTVARAVLAQSNAVLVHSSGDIVHSGAGLPVGAAGAGGPQRTLRTSLSGTRRGLALEGRTGATGWTLSWDGFDREFTPLAATPGEPEIRARVRAGTTLPLWGRASASVSYAQQTRWVGQADGIVGLVAEIPLAERTRLQMNYSLRSGADPGWQAGLTLSLPLDGRPGS